MNPLQGITSTSLLACAIGMAHAGDTPVTLPTDDQTLDWRLLPNAGAIIRYANLQGDLTGEGPYSAFIDIRRGTRLFSHYHSGSISKLVLQGTLFVVIDGQRKEYPPGSFLHIPAGSHHSSGCTAAANCRLYIHQAQTYDAHRAADGNR